MLQPRGTRFAKQRTRKMLERLRFKHLRRFLPSAIGLLIFSLLGAYALTTWRKSAGHPFRDYQLRGEWIVAAGEPTHAGYFRKRIDVTSEVRHAWIAIATTGGCEVSVNRNPMGRMYLWRPTRPFQSGSSEKGQLLHSRDAALALNFPREYQWSGHDNSRLPLFVDLTPSFQLGKNVICVEIESRSTPASVCFHGEIELWSGEKIPIRSDTSWLGEPTPHGPQSLDWTETLYWDKEWRFAKASEGVKQAQRIVPEPIYSSRFEGQWMRHPESIPSEGMRFRTTWKLNGPTIDEAWLRLIANRRFEIYVNDQQLAVASNHVSDHDNGEWLLGQSSAMDPITNPELLDPDEVGNLFVGDAFESPRKADQLLEEFTPVRPMHNMPFQYKRTTNRSEPAGVYDPERTLAESRRTPSKPDYFPERPIPNALKRDRSSGGLFAYSVSRLLKVGENKIEVRCVGKSEANWVPHIAIDGGCFNADEQLTPIPHANWQASRLDDSDRWLNVTLDGPVDFPASRLPPMNYRGISQSRSGLNRLLSDSMVSTLVVCFSLYFVAMIVAWGAGRREKRLNESVLSALYSILLIGSTVLASSLLVWMSWQEREESIWFESGLAWPTIAIGLGLVTLFAVAVELLGCFGQTQLRDGVRTLSNSLRSLPESGLWIHLLICILMLCCFLRAYKLDLQPLDDDEYASTQAILSILETGTPAFVAKDVYYTRSPLFHYLTAAIAYPFGGTLWSLRWQSVAWSIATVWLTYLCGSRLIGSRWVGGIAMFLMTIHPLEIFTGHVIRFYQMQQFFALLTVYLFCVGFVSQQRQNYRIATVVSFTAAVLSQEITAAMGVPMLFCYIVFAKDLGWRNNIQLLLAVCISVTLIALDFVAFQTLCLTRTEGVSPTVEATVKPHFWQPMNFFSLLIGYSRLHVVLSALLIAGVPLLWKGKNRNTLALFAFLVSGVVMTNLLVTNVSLRYQYWLIPLWMLISIECMRLIVSQSVRLVYDPNRHTNRYVALMTACSMIVVAGVVASFSPWRIPASYEIAILGDSTGCVRYVHSQMRNGDRLAISEPHTHAAFIEHGRIDYDVSIPLLFDYAVMRNGQLVDRNGGATMISSLDGLDDQFAKDGRVWILVNREKFRTRGKNLRWEYPGARFELFLRKNCELKYRTYLWNAYLWDPSRGHYSQFGMQR